MMLIVAGLFGQVKGSFLDVMIYTAEYFPERWRGHQ